MALPGPRPRPARVQGTDFVEARVLERLLEVLGPLPEGTASRLVQVVLSEFRRGKRAGMLEAAFLVGDADQRAEIRLLARGFEPEDLEDDLRRQGRARRRRRGPDAPW